MAHVSLYRKYRPDSFAEVVGQDHVTETLARAVDGQSWHHAYLFCGPRGTGKTSSARLLAMGLNASSGPTSHPDPNDPIVVAIREGSCPDVIEIDAASNSGVDDVRDLRDKIAYSPTQGRLRIYIVDECHMLSNSAWNAFLKTIEEPPGHVVFIFATTEPHKVLPTVLSRTQRFDFRRVSDQVLTEHCKRICAAEGVTITDEALAPIVRAGDGSVRDTLSVLDQVIAFTGNTIDAAAVNRVLGTVPSDLLDQLVNALARADVADAFTLVGQVADQGIDLRQFALDAQNHLRELMILNAAPDAGLVEGTPERLAELKASAASTDTDRLLFAVETLNDAQVRMRAGNTRLPLEVALAKAVLNGAERAKDVPRLAPTPVAPPPVAPTPVPAPVAPAPSPPAVSPVGEPASTTEPHAEAAPTPPVQPTTSQDAHPTPAPTPEVTPEPAATAGVSEPVPPEASVMLSPDEEEVLPPEPEQVESLFDDMPELAPEPAHDPVGSLAPAQPQPQQAQPQQPQPQQAQPEPQQVQSQPQQVQSQPELAQPEPQQVQSQPEQAQPEPQQAQPQPEHSAELAHSPVPTPGAAAVAPVQAEHQPAAPAPQPDQAEVASVFQDGPANQASPADQPTPQPEGMPAGAAQPVPQAQAVLSAHAPADSPTPAVPVAQAQPGATPNLTLPMAAEAWPRVLDLIMHESKRIWSIYSQGEPARVDGNTVVVGFRYPFHTSMAAEPDALAVTRRHLSTVLGLTVKVSTETNQDAELTPEPEPTSNQVLVEDYESEVEDTSTPADDDQRFQDAIALVKAELGARDTE